MAQTAKRMYVEPNQKMYRVVNTRYPNEAVKGPYAKKHTALAQAFGVYDVVEEFEFKVLNSFEKIDYMKPDEREKRLRYIFSDGAALVDKPHPTDIVKWKQKGYLDFMKEDNNGESKV